MSTTQHTLYLSIIRHPRYRYCTRIAKISRRKPGAVSGTAVIKLCVHVPEPDVIFRAPEAHVDVPAAVFEPPHIELTAER